MSMKAPNFMKTRSVAAMAAFVVASGLLFTSCKKDSKDDDSISDDEVAEAVSASVDPSTGGLVVQSETTARMAGYTTLSCGATSDSTVAGAGTVGNVSYDYSLSAHRVFSCSPLQYVVTYTGSNNYTAARMSSADNSSGSVTVTGLESGASAWILNTSYVRNGTQQSTVRYKRSFASVITITFTSLKVDKATEKIISGTGDFTFEGKGSGGYTTSRSGSITFLGNSKATLTLKNGSSYTIQW